MGNHVTPVTVIATRVYDPRTDSPLARNPVMRRVPGFDGSGEQFYPLMRYVTPEECATIQARSRTLHWRFDRESVSALILLALLAAMLLSSFWWLA